jgi:hypothetical protein
VYTLTSTAAAK